MGARLMLGIASTAVAAVVWAGVASGASSVVPSTVKVWSESPVGTDVLVSSKGFTLYHFVREAKGTIKCTGSCSILFPPLTVPAGVKPVAGPGVAAGKLGTIRRPDGRLQVTYNGLPLYRDFYDKSGQMNGQGQEGVWFAVTPAGTVTKARVRAQPAAPGSVSPAGSPPTATQTPPAGGAVPSYCVTETGPGGVPLPDDVVLPC